MHSAALSSRVTEPRFARHTITLAAGDRFAVPDTTYAVAIPEGGVHRRSFESDGATVWVVTCQLEVHESGDRVHTELLAEGETAWFRDLEISVTSARASGEATLDVVRAPYTSIPPKPAR